MPVYLSSIYPPSHRAVLYPAAIPAAGAKNNPATDPVRASKGRTPSVTTTVTIADSKISVAKDIFGGVIVLGLP